MTTYNKTWYSFETIPEDYFFRMCVSPITGSAPINVFDEVSTLQRIARNGDKEYMNATYTRIASLYSLYKKGYVALQIVGDDGKDTKPNSILFCSNDIAEELVNGNSSSIIVEYNFDCLSTPLRKQYPYYNLSAMITGAGKQWLKAMEEKYPELFEAQEDISAKIPTSTPKRWPVAVPSNYSKSGTYSLTTSLEPEE